MRIVLSTIISCFACAVSAQSLTNAGSLINIGENSIVFVKDTIVNNGTIINNGDMQVGGSWINNSEYNAGHGQITFNSNLPQIINHNDQSFSRLTISGGGEKIFLANITIENELDLTDGILVSQNNSHIVFSDGAQITGGSDDSHIRGPVYHMGTGDKVFPVGNGSIYLPVELINIQGSSAQVGIQPVELEGTLLSPSPVLNAISSNRYWKVDVVSGSLAESQVVLPVRNEAIVANAAEVVVAQSAGLSDNFESLGQRLCHEQRSGHEKPDRGWTWIGRRRVDRIQLCVTELRSVKRFPHHRQHRKFS